MEKKLFKSNYLEYFDTLKQRFSHDDAMRAAVGTDFDAIGILERELLRVSGLQPEHYLVDVGCGAGRLAVKLKGWLKGGYLGTDISRDLLIFAAGAAGRKDWRFELCDGLSIPEADGRADMVCFFSVFTHLLHEQSYVYLQEAKRVLRPGGRIVFSFIEFSSAHLWEIFEGNIRDLDKPVPLNMFMSRDMVPVWADHLDMNVLELVDSKTPHIPLAEPVQDDSGHVVEGRAWFGQSFCVLEKKS